MRLALVISSLSSGGAERVLTIMANYWAEKAHEVSIVTLVDQSETPFYDLDSTVKVNPLGLIRVSRGPLQGLANNIRRAWAIRKAVKSVKPDVVISFMDTINVITLLATMGLGVPVVVSERIDPSVQPIGKVWSALRHLCYQRAASIVVQSKRAASFFSGRLGLTTCVIPNPVQLSNEGSADVDVPKPALMSMGRLDYQKGFDILLEAFATLKDRFADWSLVILGEGPLRNSLESLAEQLGLGGRVSLPGRTRRPYSVLKQADIFVLPSRYEGFPNVLCEAMACGLPVIGSDCRSGPREIIQNDGLLVPPEDIGMLVAALTRLMGNADERKRLGARATSIVKRFSVDEVMGMWEVVLQDVQRKSLTARSLHM